MDGQTRPLAVICLPGAVIRAVRNPSLAQARAAPLSPRRQRSARQVCLCSASIAPAGHLCPRPPSRRPASCRWQCSAEEGGGAETQRRSSRLRKSLSPASVCICCGSATKSRCGATTSIHVSWPISRGLGWVAQVDGRSLGTQASSPFQHVGPAQAVQA